MANQPREAVRTCVGCRQEAGKGTLIRIVRRSQGGATIDRTGREAGRGAYLHANAECIELARKRRALDRALKTAVGGDVWAQMIDGLPVPRVGP